jgi:hypothetical protein
MKQTRNFSWNPLVFRPELPEGWKVIEQRGSAKYEETSFVRLGYGHHNEPEPRMFWVIFCEFNTNHVDNSHISYRYTVRGGNDIKPNSKIRYFKELEDAEKYMVYLMEATDRWIKEINSPKYIDAYNKRIEALKVRSEKTSESEF